MIYRNSEGYPDPSAGQAFANIARECRRERKRLERIQEKETYERLCRQFRGMAKKYGFEFPGQVWLRSKKSGFMFKDG